jgi:site-specific recombinase XerC
MAVNALRAHRERQAGDRAAAMTWSDRDLVFSTRTGAALDAANVRREFRAVCKAAGIGRNWTPRELRHSFVSLMSSTGGSATLDEHDGRSCQPIAVAGRRCQNQIGRRASRLR